MQKRKGSEETKQLESKWVRKSTLKIVYEILNVEEKDKLANRNMIKRNTERKNKVWGGEERDKKKHSTENKNPERKKI